MQPPLVTGHRHSAPFEIPNIDLCTCKLLKPRAHLCMGIVHCGPNSVYFAAVLLWFFSLRMPIGSILSFKYVYMSPGVCGIHCMCFC